MRTLILLGILFFAFQANAQNGSLTKEQQHEQILDSIKILSNSDCLYIGHGPNPTEEQRKQFEITLSFFSLDQDALEGLLQSSNHYIRVYAFGAYCEKFPKLAQSPTLEIYSDTTAAWICTSDGKVNMGMTIGELAKKMFQSAAEASQFEDKESEVCRAVQSFIARYAVFPESYEPISFSNYSFGQTVSPEEGAIPNTEHYEIQHTYQLKNKKGKTTEIAHYFKLNHAYHIVIIEEVLSKTINQQPRLKVAEWLEMYGRQLTADEQKFLELPTRPK